MSDTPIVVLNPMHSDPLSDSCLYFPMPINSMGYNCFSHILLVLVITLVGVPIQFSSMVNLSFPARFRRSHSFRASLCLELENTT